MTDERPPLILVTVGTDIHPFDRLVTSVDTWAAANPHVEVFQQFGHSDPPRHGSGAPFLPLERLYELMERAVAVVSHGGPATVADARRFGRLPIVVPRDPGHGEHVDEHQQRYAAHLGRIGRARVAASHGELRQLLSDALDDPAHFRCERDVRDLEEAIHRFGELVAALGPRTTVEPRRP